MKKRKFITHVSMGCTREQYERDLKKPLEDLGYKDCNSEWYEGAKFITNNWDGENSGIGSSHESLIKLLGGYFIDHYNPELFLALAAMTEGSNLIIGEYVYCKTDKDIFPMSSIGNIPDESGYRKPTKEELINHFTKDELICSIELYNNYMKKESQFPFELDLEGARKIIDVACDGWKTKLSEKWSHILLSGYIKISESFYKEMRAACNDEQHKVLDSVFGKDEKSVEDELVELLRGWKKDRHSLKKKLLEVFDIKFKE